MAFPNLMAGLYFAAGRSTQAACGRVHTSTQHTSEIAGKSIEPLVEMQGKLKYPQLSTACGMRPAAEYYEPIKQTHSFFFVRPAAKYEPTFKAAKQFV